MDDEAKGSRLTSVTVSRSKSLFLVFAGGVDYKRMVNDLKGLHLTNHLHSVATQTGKLQHFTNIHWIFQYEPGPVNCWTVANWLIFVLF